MNEKRPVYLSLIAFKFPITAIVSILHRISGVVLFLAVPFSIFLLQQSLQGQESFNELTECLQAPFSKLLIFLAIIALLYHLVAGVRHMLMDIGFGETKTGGRMGAITVLLTTLILAILTGVWLW